MPDITMCDQMCPDSSTCKRHSASGTTEDQISQAYWIPMKDAVISKECGMYWQIKEVE